MVRKTKRSEKHPPTVKIILLREKIVFFEFCIGLKTKKGKLTLKVIFLSKKENHDNSEKKSSESQNEENKTEESSNLVCQIDSEYLNIWIGEKGSKTAVIDSSKPYYCIIQPTDERLMFDMGIITVDEKENMLQVHRERLDYDMMIQILPYLFDFANNEKVLYAIKKCNEDKEPTIEGKVECYSNSLIEFSNGEDKEGKYFIQVYRTTEINSEKPFLIQGLFFPHENKVNDNHCKKCGRLDTEKGFGICSSSLVDVDELFDMIEDIDFEEDCVTFFFELDLLESDESNFVGELIDLEEGDVILDDDELDELANDEDDDKKETKKK